MLIPQHIFNVCDTPTLNCFILNKYKEKGIGNEHLGFPKEFLTVQLKKLESTKEGMLGLKDYHLFLLDLRNFKFGVILGNRFELAENRPKSKFT